MSMQISWRRLCRCACSAVGFLLIAYAGLRWQQFQSLPRDVPGGWCGNCLFAWLSVPLELGGAGLLLQLKAAGLDARDEPLLWALLGLGVASTPLIGGALLFLIVAVVLMGRLCRNGMRRLSAARL